MPLTISAEGYRTLETEIVKTDGQEIVLALDSFTSVSSWKDLEPSGEEQAEPAASDGHDLNRPGIAGE